MQSNFDRLFHNIDNLNGSPRKVLRSSSQGSRGGRHESDPSLRGGIRYVSQSVDELQISEGAFSLAFANAATHRGHLDKLLELDSSAVSMAETNHTASDMVDHKYVATGDRWERVNIDWGHPVRQARDQKEKGRASAGVLFASSLVWQHVDLLSSPLRPHFLAGRVLVNKVFYRPNHFAWVITLYNFVLKDGPARDSNQSLLHDVFTYLAPLHCEDVLLVGDFNIESDQDLSTIRAIRDGAFVDVAASAAPGEQICTYTCGAANTAIDRVVVSRSLWARTLALTVIEGLATGPHKPILVQFDCGPLTLHPRLNTVVPIPGSTDPCPALVHAWQCSHAEDFNLFLELAAAKDVHRLYSLWARLWESYLLLSAPTGFDRRHGQGRATGCVQFSKGEYVRKGRAILTDAERDLWRMLGLTQSIRQSRAIYPERTWRRLSLLHAATKTRRSLDFPQREDPSSMLRFEMQIQDAIARSGTWPLPTRESNGKRPCMRQAVLILSLER
eukprot:6191536-Amphidinium_carterae.3